MSSHVKRLQYQQHQQRQANLQRQYASGSLSSLGRSVTSGEGPLGYDAFTPGVAVSHLSGISGGAYHPAPKSAASYNQHGYARSGAGGSMISYNPPSTLASRSLLGRPSLYAKSSIYRSRSLGASKVSKAFN